jgi:ATP-dependent helicase/nuclease subunit B
MASGRQLYNLEPLLPYIEQGYVIVTPNLRLMRRIKGQWDQSQLASGLKAWQPLAISALEPWLMQQWQERVRLGQIESSVVLDDSRCKLLWQQVIEGDSGDVELSLLRPAAAAEQTAQARNMLLRWQIDLSATAVASAFELDQDCSSYLRWHRQFEQALAEGGLSTAADAQVQLLRVAQPDQDLKLLLVDFDDIPPLQQNCLAALAASVDALQSSGEPAAHEARACPDKKSEIAEIARWAVAQSKQDPSAALGIVLIDMAGDRDALEYALRREFDCLGENYASLPVNFSTGISLDRAPVIRDALAMLAATTGPVLLTDITRLLQSRFSCHQDGRSDLAVRLLSKLYDNGLQFVDTGQLRYMANSAGNEGEQGLALGTTLQQLAALRLERKVQLPSAWLQSICDILDCWGWPGSGSLDSLEYQQVEQWYQLLERYAELDQVSSAVSFGDMLKGLRFLTQSQVSQPQTADSNIQVLGSLEAAGLGFDQLWLCGLQASRWPPPPRANPFIPQQLQSQHDMPHASAEREWRFVEHLMGQFLRASGKVVASYCSEVDGVPELASAMLAEWPLVQSESVDGLVLAPQWLDLHQALPVEVVEPKPAPRVGDTERTQLSGGSGIVEDQANCPFRAFAKRRLRLQPLGDYRVALTAADRGNLLHDALFALWGSLEDSATLLQQSSESLQRLAEDSARAALEKVSTRLRELVGMPVLELERQRLSTLLIEWMDIERARPPFKVIAREETVQANLGGLELRLRIDRIDQLAGGSQLLIDYKSGSNSLAGWLGERPSSPQLPLYGAVEDDVAALAFAEVRSRKSRLLGLGDVEGIDGVKHDIAKAVKNYSGAQDWAQLRAEWQRNLEGLAQAFLAGDARVDPLPTACNYCGLEALCRVGLPTQTKEATQ